MVESINEEEWEILKELVIKKDGWFVPGLSMKMKQKTGEKGEEANRTP